MWMLPAGQVFNFETNNCSLCNKINVKVFRFYSLSLMRCIFSLGMYIKIRNLTQFESSITRVNCICICSEALSVGNRHYIRFIGLIYLWENISAPRIYAERAFVLGLNTLRRRPWFRKCLLEWKLCSCWEKYLG